MLLARDCAWGFSAGCVGVGDEQRKTSVCDAASVGVGTDVSVGISIAVSVPVSDSAASTSDVWTHASAELETTTGSSSG